MIWNCSRPHLIINPILKEICTEKLRQNIRNKYDSFILDEALYFKLYTIFLMIFQTYRFEKLGYIMFIINRKETKTLGEKDNGRKFWRWRAAIRLQTNGYIKQSSIVQQQMISLIQEGLKRKIN